MSDVAGPGSAQTRGAWPAVGMETVEWRIHDWEIIRLGLASRDDLERPYQAAVLSPIADLNPGPSAETIQLLDLATNEVARFDVESAAACVPMPAILLRTESASSSQIEQLTTSARQLALSMLGQGSKRNAELVAANTRAMMAALDIDDVTAEGLSAVHRTLLTQYEPQIAGHWRQEQVWIGGTSLSPHRAAFVPPAFERIPTYIDDMVVFAARRDIPVLVQAAITHAQFETIHPFADGNGRTGRVLIHTILRRRGLACNTTVPVSSGLLHDVDSYFRALASYREGNIDPIIQQVAQGALSAVVNGRILIAQIGQVREQWAGKITTRSGSFAHRLADQLFAQPVIDGPYVNKTFGVAPGTALSAIGALQDAGILTQVRPGRRNRVWLAPDALKVMDAFAERAGRRVLGVPHSHQTGQDQAKTPSPPASSTPIDPASSVAGMGVR